MEVKGLIGTLFKPLVIIIIRRDILQKMPQSTQVRKLVLVLATSTLMTGVNKEVT